MESITALLRIGLWIEERTHSGMGTPELEQRLVVGFLDEDVQIAPETLLRFRGPVPPENARRGRERLLGAVASALRSTMHPISATAIRTWGGDVVDVVSQPIPDSPPEGEVEVRVKFSDDDVRIGPARFLRYGEDGADGMTLRVSEWTAYKAPAENDKLTEEFVEIGFWSNSVVSGKVHPHDRNQADSAYHRTCVPVFRRGQ